MKKFYDRVREMNELMELQRQAYNDYSRFVVLAGRRRVGKTSLVYRLMSETQNDAPGLYFFVGRKTETVLVRSFVQEVREKLGEFVPDGMSSFRELFQMILEIGKRRRFTLFIDEFQEFDNINAGIFSDIQELWDAYKKQANVCMIVSVSIFRMMEKIFKDEEQPLFGRDDSTIKLKPFNTGTIKEILGDYKPNYTSEDSAESRSIIFRVCGAESLYVVSKQLFFEKVLVVRNIFIIFAPRNSLNHIVMDALFRKSDRLLANTSTEIVREKMNEIHWNAQLISIMGAKGVGKSTLIRQYLKQNYQPLDRRMLYCSADTVDFSTRTLVELAEEFSIRGGELLVIDEIHKYKSGTSDWSREVKEIYELFPDLKLIVSGSSLLQLREGDADLSRRAVKYTMSGLSFREALRFYHGLEFEKWSLEDILSHPYDLWQTVTSKCKPVALFKEYLEKGYYPFLLEGEGEYFTKIEQVVNYIIETELPRICKVDVANVRKLQALIALICSEVPFELNANRIAAALEIGRDTVVEYLKYLGDAKVLNLLYSDKKKIGKLSKPNKVYLENPNILYALAPTKTDIGTLRETFAIGSLSESHNVEYGKAQGDFKVDGKYTFEIGGRSKDFSQIAGVKDSYVFADDWDMPDGAKLPLWMLGFLY